MSIHLFRLLVYVLSSNLQARVKLRGPKHFLSHQGPMSEDCGLFKSSFPSGFDAKKVRKKITNKHEYKLDALDSNMTIAGGSPLWTKLRSRGLDKCCNDGNASGASAICCAHTVGQLGFLLSSSSRSSTPRISCSCGFYQSCSCKYLRMSPSRN